MTGVPVVRADGLRRKYDDHEALRGVTFSVPEGCVYGLVGRNGSGKTTTIRLLLGLLRPDDGASSVFGEDSLALSAATRRRIGYLSEEDFPYDDLPVPELLRWLSAFFPAWNWDRVERWTKRFDVSPTQDLKSMSKGERRRAELLLVLAQDPDLLILDDPALGLDVTVRREFLGAALEISRDEGKTVLFTSHVLTDMERVVETVALLEDGTVRTEARLDDLKASTKRLVFPDGANASIVVPGEVTRRVERGDLVVVTEAFGDAIERRLREACPALQVEDLNLEEIFVEVLGRKPDAAATTAGQKA
ncbi:MAG: ABC transporter ATP-binding protein [Planctomycetes bacterium]|nr:ABC transporter ATP-binding protein [Planctomycetota bacterium]